MPAFGPFHTERELGRFAVQAVYAAGTEPGKADHTLVVVQPSPAMSEDAAAAVLDRFAQSVAIHRQVAEAKVPHWPSIAASETTESHAWYAAAGVYGSSLQRIIAGRVRLEHDGIRRIVLDILEALAGLHAATQRAHGQLSEPRHVWIEQVIAGMPSGVALTAPSPDDAMSQPEAFAEDLHDLGRLIFQLIAHRPPAQGQQRIQPTEAFARFGKHAQAWADLINGCLAAGPTTTHDELASLVPAASRPWPRGPIAAAAALAVCAAVAGGGWWVLQSDREEAGPTITVAEDLDVDEAWRDLIAMHRAWLGGFVEAVAAREPQIRSDAYIDERVLTPAKEAILGNIELSPATIAEQTVVREGDPLPETPPQQEQVGIAWTVADQFRRALVDHEWPAAAELAAARDRYAARGWDEAATAATTMLDDLEPGYNAGERMADAMVRIIETADVVADIEAAYETQQEAVAALGEADAAFASLEQMTSDAVAARPAADAPLPGLLAQLETVNEQLDTLRREWDQLVEQRQRIEGSDDAVFRDFGGFVTQTLLAPRADGSPLTLQQVRSRLTRLQPLAEELEAFVAEHWPRVRREHLPDASPSELSREVFQQRLAAARDALPVTEEADPRRPAAWEDRLAAIREVLDELEDDEMYPELREQFDALAEQRRMVTQATYVRAQLEQAEDDARALTQQLAAFERAVLEASGDPARWLPEARQRELAVATAAADDAWQRHRERLLGNISVAELEDDRARFRQLREVVDRLADTIESLESDFPRVSSALDGGRVDQPWSTAFVEAIEALRRERIGDALALAPLGDVESLESEALADSWQSVVGEYESELEQAGALFEQTNELASLLADAALPDEATAARDATIASLVQQWRGRALLEREDIADAVSAVFAPAEAVIAAGSEDDAAVLTALIERADADAEPALVRTAWLRLGNITHGWPADLAELRQELSLRDKAAQAIDSLGSDRRAELASELQRIAPERWLTCYEQLDRRSDIAAALDLRERFGVVDDQLPAAVRFDVLVHAARLTAAERAEGESVESAEAVAMVRDLLDEIDSLEAVAGDDRVAALRAELTPLLEESEDAGPNPAASGPASDAVAEARRWEATVLDNGRRIRFDWQHHQLNFVRVQVEGEAPAYISTSEVPVGLFVDVMRDSQLWEQVEAVMPRANSGLVDSRSGPRVWERDAAGEQIQIADEWLFQSISDMGPEQVHFDGAQPGRPSDRSPMQHVSPHGALLMAAAIGCRMPTAAEWQAAREMFPGDDRPNLRDTTWRRQRDHIEEEIQKLGNVPGSPDYPDAGIFRPLPEAVGGASIPRGPRAEPATDEDDGQLWFAEVDAESASPEHLVGNVAEFVMETEAEALPLSPVTAERSQQVVDGARVAVIGGSALSPPEVSPDQPFEARIGPREGFSDVGFRLAFSAGSLPLINRLAEVLSDQPYLAQSGS